ncbi:TRAM domain-containing protein, partial [Candidatus Pelagibacter sp.]|nr:TRAM domain-containing protein [Candidatus Pelagibacter sp.]
GKTLEVLVENKLENQNKYFGRNKFLNSVIFDGNESHIGKIIKVNVEKSNQNSLFGKVIDEMKAA